MSGQRARLESLGVEVRDQDAAADPESDILDTALAALRQQGFEIVKAREEYPEFVFFDIGAVIHQLRQVPWQAPGFDPYTHRDQLRQLHDRIIRDGGLTTHNHRYLIQVRQPG